MIKNKRKKNEKLERNFTETPENNYVSLVCSVLLCCHFPVWRPGSGMVLDCIDS